MLCPGSVGLGEGVRDDESDHAHLGTSAHALAADCLNFDHDAWTQVGNPCGEGLWVDKDMADAVQVYLDAVRKLHPDRNQGNTFIERAFHCPSIHELFYGTTDLAYLDAEKRVLHVWDYKHGAGVVVEVKDNPQLMYYGVGALEELGVGDVNVADVVFHIAQPRGFHFDGPVREWSMRASALYDWAFDVLVPAMDRAMVSRDTASGEHCRFCPVRSRACPQLLADADELETLMALTKGTADELSNEQVARFLDLMESVKIAGSAANKTAFSRMQAGHAIRGRKLVKARANRVWKDGAEDAIKAKFGKDAYSTAELLSPAQLEKLPEGESFCARWAFKPDAGLTVGKGDDARPGVSKDTKSLFQAATKQRKGK